MLSDFMYDVAGIKFQKNIKGIVPGYYAI